MTMTITDFRVAKTTNVDRLAGAIAHAIRRGDGIDLVAYGRKQIGIAAQGTALAREFLLEDGVGLAVEIQMVQIALAPDRMGYGIKIALRACALYTEDNAEPASSYAELCQPTVQVA